jgi:leucyl-tRNA synthetase
LLLLLSPFATETSQELWTKLGHNDQIATQWRPEYKSEYVANMKINLAVQINGKTRWTVEVDSWITQDQALNIIKSSEQFDKYLVGEIRKIIYVQDKICNLIVG